MYKTLAIVAVLLAVVSATHYRYGVITYQPVGANTLRFQIDQAWRRTAFGITAVGQTFNVGGITWGDSTSSNLDIVATSVNLVDDIVAGTATIVKTYGSAGVFTVEWSTCCRISTLRNNADGSTRAFTTVNLRDYPSNRSPVSNLLPIVICGRSTPFTFQITAVDPDGDSLSFRLATTAEFLGSTHPSGTSISASGLYSWNNNALTDGLYNTAVVITDGKCSIMVDFLMQLTNIVVPSNTPPVWSASTPTDGQAFSAQINSPISFALTCTDADAGNTVTIQSGSLPQGASLTAQSGSNPGARSFTMTSSTINTYVACFQCNDNNNAVAGQRCVSLVFSGGCCDINTQPATLNGVPSNLALECGASIPPAATVTASFTCPTPGTQAVTASETSTGNVCNRVITRSWSFTDSCGRTSSASQTITIRDTVAPTIDSSAAISQTVQCGSGTSPASTGSISASDNCDNSVTIGSSDSTTPSSCLSVSSISRRWTATDDCNNVAVYTQTVNVVDSLQPTLTVPANSVRQCAIDAYTPAATGSATASDVCDSSVVPTYSDAPSASGCLALGNIARTWTAVDDCGNSVSGVQSITFEDTIAPTTSVDPVCVFPPNGQYYCFDTLTADFLHYSDACSATSHSYNFDCADSNGDASGCVVRGNELCVRASTDHQSDNTYTFSFTVTDACGNSKVQAAAITVPNTASAASPNCRAPTVCINDCPETQCEGSSFDLVSEDGDIIGSVFISNKLDYELQIEVKTNEGAIPDRGWWMLGLNIQVGTKRVVKDWTRNNAQSRWFATIDLRPDGLAECDGEIDVIIAVLATNDKRNNNGATVRAYPAQASKRSFSLPPNIQDYSIQYSICCECTIRTQTQNDFGNLCYAQPTPSRTSDSQRIREIACYTHDFWTWSADWCFPNGLVVGCSNGFTVTYTNPTAVATGWADETSAHVLTQNYVDPDRRQVGLLAAETAALTLNTKLDECDADFSSSCTHIGDYAVCEHPNSDHPDCQPFWGRTVSDILDEANKVVGGCQSGNVNALATCVRFINRAFVDGKRLWEAADFQYGACGGPSK